jgi:hypothetical protein
MKKSKAVLAANLKDINVGKFISFLLVSSNTNEENTFLKYDL